MQPADDLWPAANHLRIDQPYQISEPARLVEIRVVSVSRVENDWPARIQIEMRCQFFPGAGVARSKVPIELRRAGDLNIVRRVALNLDSFLAIDFIPNGQPVRPAANALVNVVPTAHDSQSGNAE